MVSKIYWKMKKDINVEITKYPGIYAVQSERPGLIYGISDGKFALLTQHGAVYCPLHETVEMAEMMQPDIKAEILEIYEDVKSLRLDRRRNEESIHKRKNHRTA